jgi:hypothetical protein
MTQSDRFCVVCGKRLEESVGKNAFTHPGSCRDENTQKLLKKHNRDVKRDRIQRILVFLEERFRRGMDIDALRDTLANISMHHTSVDDFVMTAYYLDTIESGAGVTIRDIQSAADAFDDANGGKRSDAIKARVVKILDTVERYIDTSAIRAVLNGPGWRSMVTKMVWNIVDIPGNEYSLYIRRAFSRIKRLLNQKVGYSKHAHKMLKSCIDDHDHDIDTRIETLIRSSVTTLAIDPAVVDEMIDLYRTTLRMPLRGRDPIVIVGGIIYYMSRKHSLSLPQKTIAAMLKTSPPSLRRVYTTISSVADDVTAVTSWKNPS